MAIPVIMPRQGQSVESCIITKWHKKKGDKVKIGDILFSYETDKSAFDEEAKDEGTLLDIFFNEGDDVECLLTVCVIGNEGEDYSAFIPQQVAGGEEKGTVMEVKAKGHRESIGVQRTDDRDTTIKNKYIIISIKRAHVFYIFFT